MEIKINAHLTDAEERTTTRDKFWSEARGRGVKVESAEVAERQIFERLPRELENRIRVFIKHDQDSRITPWFFVPFRRRILPNYELSISVKSLRYGSLEILLSLIAGGQFPLSATEVVQLLGIFSPQAISTILNDPPPGVPRVTVDDANGPLHIGQGSDAGSLTRRAYYLANFSLLVPVALSLGVCYVTFNAMVAQINIATEERKQLLRDQLAQTNMLAEERMTFLRDQLAQTNKIAEERKALMHDLTMESARIVRDRSQLGSVPR
jgi:hypothetical protein